MQRARWPFVGAGARAPWLLAWGATAFAILAFAGLVLLLGVQSLPVWQHAGVGGVLGGERWFYRAREFGALPMLYGTLVVAGIALGLAAPLGIGAAVWLSEMLDERVRLPVKAALELLAGIPSVVYGLLGILLLRPLLGPWLAPWGAVGGDALLTAGVLLAVMVLPTLVTLADDALRGVSTAERHAARALGLTRAEGLFAVVLPGARAGLVGAVLLALGRALGETIAVFLVVGRQDNQLPGAWLDPRGWLGPGQTLATKLGGAETWIAFGDPLHWAAMLALAAILAMLVLGVTWLGTRKLATTGGQDAPTLR